MVVGCAKTSGRDGHAFFRRFAWHHDGFSFDAADDSGARREAFSACGSGIAQTGPLDSPHELWRNLQARAAAERGVEKTWIARWRSRGFADVESRQPSGGVLGSAVRGRRAAHAEFAAASGGDRSDCKARGGPLSACG